jgi:pyrroloquinoline quinone (PQQ) biosynthesis protein C
MPKEGSAMVEGAELEMPYDLLARMRTAEGTDTATLLSAGLQGPSRLDTLFAAATKLDHLAAAGAGVSGPLYADYQAILFYLHKCAHGPSQGTRNWLASRVYAVEDRALRRADPLETTSAAGFRQKVDDEIAARSRITHPMSSYLFAGRPSRDEIRVFIAHHWLRSHDFYRLLAELAFRFDRLDDASVFYRNLYGESGAEDARRSHPRLLERLISYLGLPLEIDWTKAPTEELAYLNNRLRSVRHHDPAWGLACVYAIESVSRVNHGKIYEMLRRADIPDESCEFHRLHSIADEIDTDELWTLIEPRAQDPEFRATFMRSLERHFALTGAYFDVLWSELQESSRARGGGHERS